MLGRENCQLPEHQTLAVSPVTSIILSQIPLSTTYRGQSRPVKYTFRRAL